MPASTTFPANPPTVDGFTLSVDLMLQQPTFINRRITNLASQRLVADYAFSAGAPAPGGAVVFDRILAQDLYTTRDVQEIEPGAEFPIVDDGETAPQVAKVAKRGGMAMITYEAQRRNAIDVMDRKLTRLTNTLVRKIDTVAIAVLDADPNIVGVTGTQWKSATAGDPISDILMAKSVVLNRDLGYDVDTALINPADVMSLFRRKDIRDALPRENAATNPLLSGTINGLMGLNWVESNRVPVGTVYLLQKGVAGSMHDEIPQYTRVIDDQKAETWYVQAARVTVPVITDPLCVYKLTGIAA